MSPDRIEGGVRARRRRPRLTQLPPESLPNLRGALLHHRGYSTFMSIERILTIVVLVLGAIALIIWILANV